MEKCSGQTTSSKMYRGRQFKTYTKVAGIWWVAVGKLCVVSKLHLAPDSSKVLLGPVNAKFDCAVINICFTNHGLDLDTNFFVWLLV